MVKKTQSYPKKLEPLNLHAHRLNGDLIPKTDLIGFTKQENIWPKKKETGQIWGWAKPTVLGKPIARRALAKG